ncbi:sigma-70 family RNA polymerase sigma factor [Streptomyces sp. NPDC048643]|uniref:sigma-70 family RNA polymerase sigma factor n=1 Tax=Streptomyces sp. NPDC048643 TaxID=3155637 RepID=UPI003426AEA7
MDGHDELALRFEAQRGRLWAVAHRMLGSASEADDAVQETWLRLGRVDAGTVENLPGWLRTVVSRICLDMLRARTARREEFVGGPLPEAFEAPDDGADPAREAERADAVGLALLVVLDTLTPAERIAFVLHDLFAVPFEDIAPVVDRTRTTAKKLASRARHKVRGTPAVSAVDLAVQRRVVEAFLAAARGGDIGALLAVLDPDVVRRADPGAVPAGVPTEVRGARAVAAETVLLRRQALHAAPALLDGRAGLVVAPGGRLLLALTVAVDGERITSYEVIADPVRLRALDLAVPEGWSGPTGSEPRREPPGEPRASADRTGRAGGPR